MANVPSERRSKKAAYLAGYFALLLITTLGLAVQGGAPYVLAAAGLGIAVLGSFLYLDHVNNAKCLRVPREIETMLGGRMQSV